MINFSDLGVDPQSYSGIDIKRYPHVFILPHEHTRVERRWDGRTLAWPTTEVHCWMNSQTPCWWTDGNGMPILDSEDRLCAVIATPSKHVAALIKMFWQ